MNVHFDITRAAEDEIVRAANARSPFPGALLIGIRAGGCDGFSYVFEWVDRDDLIDVICGVAEGINDETGSYSQVLLVSDPKSLGLLSGATLDHEKTLMRSGFKWINPRQTGQCGCGKSVQF